MELSVRSGWGQALVHDVRQPRHAKRPAALVGNRAEDLSTEQLWELLRLDL